MEIFTAKALFSARTGEQTDFCLLNAIFEINGFRLRSFNELDAFFDDPEPELDIELTSAGVFALTAKSKSIVLVEFATEDGERRVELPAGKVNKTLDATITDTALREFAEETGGIFGVPKLAPFAAVAHTPDSGGLQFVAKIAEPKHRYRDMVGRRYITPPPATDGGKVKAVVLEPLAVFADPTKSLLRYSRNPWAVEVETRMTLLAVLAR